ncbi:flagellar filament capping protein FliD [Desulfovibrio sp.]|uniref:flagellar filament capping protein FliD n=1 Tax=Desulfovibrio sp. TaxID=885 RepID=UPI0023CC41F0|nr:flagellar filament capping protein FliD [Desulfovibrio sp.]MDE7242147.1 flagellar filament capping protein FliD [Desulfovibrio sp.]
MGISISGSNAISGLGGNDTDFDKVLTQLKQIEKTQLNRLEAWKSDWQLRYDGFTQIIDQIQAASSMLAKLSDKNNFVTKLVNSSNDNILTAVANASAQDVQHTVKVNQVASNAIWANTGHVFESKTDIINTTGENQYFSYTYAGKRHDFKVPPNTTLDSFVSMVNNSSDNPGIKLSLIQTGSGYVFQVAGKDTGAANDLIIHDSKLVGMDATGSTSTWQTNAALDLGETMTSPTKYVFDLVLANGSKKSVTVSGDKSPEDLCAALENAAGKGVIKAEVGADGTLTISGVQSFSRRTAGDEAYVPASTQVTLAGELKDNKGEYVKLNAEGGLADGLADDDLITFTMTLDDGTTRSFDIKAGATKRDLLVQMAQATQEDTSLDIGLMGNSWGTNLSGVRRVSFAAQNDATLNDSVLKTKTTDATGVRDTLGGTMQAATTLTFKDDKLAERVDGKEAGADAGDLVYTLTTQSGQVYYLKGLKGDMTNGDLADAIKNGQGLVDADGNAVTWGEAGITMTFDDDAGTVSLDGVLSFRLTTGSASAEGYSASLSATTTITAANGNPGATSSGNLFYQPAEGGFQLEKTPDLVYTITTNSGVTGTLTLASGTSMKDVLAALKDPTNAGWAWTDAAGDPATAPADFGVRFTDANGKEYLDASGNPLAPDAIDGPVYLNFDNAQAASGPGVTGQVATSSNWNIQRAANARYQVDNWPIEMESASNKITDVIEGVVFTIQDVGEARMSVSTDITSVEQSIQDFLDAVNSVLLTVNDLMKYDETKEVTSNDPNDIGNSNYSASGLTNQKGGILMGNYGVQLFKSRFSSVLSSSPPGFKSRQSATDVLSGDVLASLANLGIKTDTDQNSDTYGLLVIAPSSSIAELQSIDKENYSSMITDNLEAVVDFFCASGTGSSTSTDFRYGSHVEGITKGGNYEVKYSVDEDGNITKVTVGGVEAKRDESQAGYYYSVASGDARGLSILIDDLTPGEHPPAGEDPMYVRIKQGLVQTTQSFLKDELVFNDVNISANSTPKQIEDAMALKAKNGALMSLRDNYMTVMKNIDVKIEREQRRLETWESRQKAIFANLETLLKQYDEKQTSLEAQLKQLGGNS